MDGFSGRWSGNRVTTQRLITFWGLFVYDEWVNWIQSCHQFSMLSMACRSEVQGRPRLFHGVTVAAVSASGAGANLLLTKTMPRHVVGSFWKEMKFVHIHHHDKISWNKEFDHTVLNSLSRQNWKFTMESELRREVTLDGLNWILISRRNQLYKGDWRLWDMVMEKICSSREKLPVKLKSHLGGDTLKTRLIWLTSLHNNLSEKQTQWGPSRFSEWNLSDLLFVLVCRYLWKVQAVNFGLRLTNIHATLQFVIAFSLEIRTQK